ncbi:MAG: hypothetical protein LR008_01500 [Candidatus Pacebacteria bacterium]|nr:hypothetical protein [Candidatus Paceibacterota bacterium]
MIRFYSLFVTDDKLLASPYISNFNTDHDLTIHRGKKETVTFLLQTPITEKQHLELKIIYDPLTLNISKAEIKPFQHQTLISLDINPKEVGVVKLGLEYPDCKQTTGYQFRKVVPPLTSVLGINLEKDMQGKLFSFFK